jgi:CheY-like chemotaxis protein
MSEPVTHPDVLVVDDDDQIRAVLADLLTWEGYTVAIADNGEAALAQIERAAPRVMLLDMRMPVLDGWGVARELGRRELAIPTVVMTAAQDARRWAQEIGADAYLAKPFEIQDLMATLERLLAERC